MTKGLVGMNPAAWVSSSASWASSNLPLNCIHSTWRSPQFNEGLL